MRGLSSGVDEFYIGWDLIDSDTTTISRNFTLLETGDNTYIYYKRKVTEDAISKLNIDYMPGFQLEWYYFCISFQDATEDNEEIPEENEEIASTVPLRLFSEQSIQLIRYIVFISLLKNTQQYI